MKRCVTISCFDYYDLRMKMINEYYIKNGYELTYLYADYNHFTKKINSIERPHGHKIHVDVYRRNLSYTRIKSHLGFAKEVSKIVNLINPDLIYCVIPPNILVKYLSEYKMTHNVKLIFDCYDFWPESFPYNYIRKLLFIPFYYWGLLRKKYINTADLVVTVSELAKSRLSKEVTKDILVIKPVIINNEIPTFDNDLSKMSFCYLGHVNHILDMDLCYKMLRKISMKKEIEIHFIGEGINLQMFIQKLEKIRIKVHKHGSVYDMDLKNLIFSKCIFGLNMPRKEVESSMALKFIEYLRAGIPVINSGIGDSMELVEKYHLGKNINKYNLERVVDDICSYTDSDIAELRRNCLIAYREEFLNIDLKKLLCT